MNMEHLEKKEGASSFWIRAFQLRWLVFFLSLLQISVNVDAWFIRRPSGLSGLSDWPLMLLSPILFTMLLMALIALIRHSLIRKVVLSVITFIVVYLYLFESYLLLTYNTMYNEAIAQTILATHLAETKEYFLSVFNPAIFIVPILKLIGAMVLATGASYLIALLVTKRSHRISKRLVLTLGIVACVCCLGINFVRGTTPRALRPTTLSSLERIGYSTRLYIKEMREARALLANIQRSPIEGLELLDTISEPHSVVVIIGESLRRDYMSCYGYPIATTPRLDSMVRDNDGLILFDDVVSAYAWTEASIAETMSFHTLRDSLAWYHYPTLPRLLSATDRYHSYWASIQEKNGSDIQSVAAIAATADSTYYTAGKNSWGVSHHDGEILKSLRHASDVNKSTGKNLFEVLHLIGSHFRFQDRYPKEYAHFQPKDLIEKRGDDKDKQVVHYLNSIYYNDWVVTNIFRRYDSEPAIIFYFADHGVSVYDNKNNPEHLGHEAVTQNLEIPFMVYITPPMRALKPELYQAISQAKNSPLQLDTFAPSLASLLGVKSKYNDDSRNFFSDKYDKTQTRLGMGVGGERIPIPERQPR